MTAIARRVVVGVDGSEGSRRALEWAARFAVATDAEVVAAHVLTYSHEFAKDLSLDTMRAWRTELRHDLETHWIEPLVDAGVDHRSIVVEDDSPAAGLLRLCDGEHADLIVLGAKSHRGLGDRILGGVTYRVTHSARLPVVVVPPEWRSMCPPSDSGARMKRPAQGRAPRRAVGFAVRAATLVALLGLLVLTLIGRPDAADEVSSARETGSVAGTELTHFDAVDTALTRSSFVRAIALPVVVIMLALVTHAVVSELIGRSRRRIGDDGDAWRSLLFGAPPVVA